MVTVCDISAWQYWRTPPVLRDGWMEPDRLRGLLPSNSPELALLRPQRANAREADRLVRTRLLADLKGVSLPVHVMANGTCSRHRTGVIIVHRTPESLPPDAVVDLGNGLSVLSPEFTVATRVRPASIVSVAKMAFEACGIFSLLPSNPRIDAALNDLVACGVLTRNNCRHDGIFGYSDDRGRRLGFLDAMGEPLPWTPAFDRLGRITDLWKRPPLTSVEAIASAIGGLSGIAGLATTRRALKACRDGAASPAEVQANLLLCSGPWFGGESWGQPDLNRRVLFSPTAQALAHTSFCIADCLWPERKADLEIQGAASHADKQGFAVATGRRPALESMGYTVQELTYEQMANLELFDAILPVLAKNLGFPLQRRTTAFLRRRGALHRELFEAPYDPE